MKCVLDEYDLEVSKLNECVVFSKDKHDGGMGCVLDALETCTEKVTSEGRWLLMVWATAFLSHCRHSSLLGRSPSTPSTRLTTVSVETAVDIN